MMTTMSTARLLCAIATIWLTYDRVAGLSMKRNDGIRGFWITMGGPIRKELLDVQAIIVKDEEIVAGTAECGPNNTDARYSDKRYLMCAGSILTSRHILTSASCIHEATYVRHNIRATLAAMVAPFSETSQVLRISEYNVHPSHQVDPRKDDHALHNVAIVKLACRILKTNSKKVLMPKQPTFDYCEEDNCFVTIIKKTSKVSYSMIESEAKNIVDKRDKRELSQATDEIQESSDQVPLDEIRKILDTNSNTKSANPQVRKIRGTGDKNRKSFSTNFTSKFKKLFVRTTHEAQGCPQSGSAVMSGKIQTSLLVASCDERQLESTWQYTDLFDNIDWIQEMMGRWKPSKSAKPRDCQMCTYNFFFNYNFKDKIMCRKEGQENNQDEANIASINLPVCPENYTVGNEQKSSIDSTRRSSKKESKKGSLSLNLAYYNAVNNMYTNTHFRANVSTENNVGPTSSAFLESSSEPALRKSIPMPWEITPPFILKESTNLMIKNYSSNLDTNHRNPDISTKQYLDNNNNSKSRKPQMDTETLERKFQELLKSIGE